MVQIFNRASDDISKKEETITVSTIRVWQIETASISIDVSKYDKR